MSFLLCHLPAQVDLLSILALLEHQVRSAFAMRRRTRWHLLRDAQLVAVEIEAVEVDVEENMQQVIEAPEVLLVKEAVILSFLRLSVAVRLKLMAPAAGSGFRWE